MLGENRKRLILSIKVRLYGASTLVRASLAPKVAYRVFCYTFLINSSSDGVLTPQIILYSTTLNRNMKLGQAPRKKSRNKKIDFVSFYFPQSVREKLRWRTRMSYSRETQLKYRLNTTQCYVSDVYCVAVPIEMINTRWIGANILALNRQ